MAVNDMYYAYSGNEAIKEKGEYGGVVTTIMKYLLEEGIVDAEQDTDTDADDLRDTHFLALLFAPKRLDRGHDGLNEHRNQNDGDELHLSSSYCFLCSKSSIR